jgi:hypothetical protein
MQPPLLPKKISFLARNRVKGVRGTKHFLQRLLPVIDLEASPLSAPSESIGATPITTLARPSNASPLAS